MTHSRNFTHPPGHGSKVTGQALGSTLIARGMTADQNGMPLDPMAFYTYEDRSGTLLRCWRTGTRPKTTR